MCTVKRQGTGCGEELRNTCGVHHPEAQAHSKSNHGTMEHFPCAYTPPSHYERPVYSSSFYPVHHVRLLRKNYKVHQKAKNTLGRQSKHQNMAGLLELSDKKFKTTMVNMLGALRYKAGSIQEPKRSVGD